MAGILICFLLVLVLAFAGCTGTTGQAATASSALEKNITTITSEP